MKVLAISLTLLLFQLRNISAHAIPRIEPSNASVIYEVQENNATTLRLINPKPEEPVLREIIYYHVIERAYGSGGDQDDKTISNEEPDFDDTRRPFTNGHGFPLPDEADETNIDKEKETKEEPNLIEEELIEVPEEEDSDPNDLVPEPDIIMTEDEVNDNNATVEMVQYEPEGVAFYEIVDGEEVPVYYYYEEVPEDAQKAEEAAVQETPEVMADNNETENAKIVDETPKDNPEKDDAKMKDTKDIEDVEILSEAGEEVTEAADPVVTVDDVIIEVTEATDPVVAVDDVIIEKTKARNQLFENLKEKYEQKIKHTEKSSSRRKRNIKIPEAPMLPELNYDMFPEYIRTIISTEKPPTTTGKAIDFQLEQFDDDEEDLKEEMENKIEAILENLKPLEAEAYGSEEKATRTYGMNLTGDHGYVWNDLWTNPGISYDVGHIVDDKDNEDVNKPKPSDSNEDVFEIPYEPDSSKDVSHKDEDLDIFVEIDKRKDKPDKELPKDDRNKPEVNVDLVENKDETKDISGDQINENIDNKDKEVDQLDIEEKNKVDETEIPEEKDNIGHKPDKDETKEPKEDNKVVDKKTDTFSELMKNEQFWKWLAEWTSTYMELLTKHIKKIVKDEVDNQMNVYIESVKDNNPEKDKEEITLESKKEEVEEIKEPIEEPVIKNDTIIIDGKEIPITNNTNFDQEELLKRRKDKENKLPNLPIPTVNDTKIPVPVNNITENKAPIRISAQTIYGNSAGNDKVTNIFIFYNKDSENIISDLKPKNDTVNNTFIFGQTDNATNEEKVIEIPKIDEKIENKLEEINKVSPSNNSDQNKQPVEDLSSKDQEDSKVSNEISDKTKEPALDKDLTLEENKNEDKEVKEEEPNEKISEQNNEDNKMDNKDINHEETKEERPNKEENQQTIDDPKEQSNEVNKLESKGESKEETKDDHGEHKAETKEEQVENRDETKEGTDKMDNVEKKEDGKEPNKEESKEDNIDKAIEDKDETKENTEVENEDKAKEEPKDENKPDVEDTNAVNNKEVNAENTDNL